MSIKHTSFRVCFCCSRRFKMKAAEPPDDIKNKFEEYSENGTMSIDQLHSFLIEVQGEANATKEDAQTIFNSLKLVNVFHRRGLHLEAFFRFLLGDHNLAFSSSTLVKQDMNAPLAHYYIYTGHNSYLTGNQISSDSSVIPIIESLRRGVRVIELDLWPNSTDDSVEVRHGGTLTTPVELIKCLRAIKENAFIASEYPVVVTFEDHINPNLQSKVAQMVKKTFGKMLFRPETELKEFPSPEKLKKMILISTKPPESRSTNEKEKENMQRQEYLADDEILGIDKSDSIEELEDMDGHEVYKSLISIHAGKLKGGLDNAFSNIDKVRRLSLSEQELKDAARTQGPDIVRFTQRNFLRVYPKGMRLDSSNYNPMVGWSHGAQMVAFNMQGHGKYLWIMEGMFKANGGCGYVKKPDFLLTEGQVFDPRAKRLPKVIFRVVVYVGEGWHLDFRHTHFDIYSPPDFFVKVGIAGVLDDKAMKQTRAVEDQWNPVWNQEFEFPLTVPELALLRVEVVEYDSSGNHDFGGQTCLPIHELRTGIRAVPLCDKRGLQFRSARLLMGFELINLH